MQSELTDALVAQTDQDYVEIPEDYESFVAFRETGEVPAKAEEQEEEAPAAGARVTPPSESSEEEEEIREGQSATESEPGGEAEQEEVQAAQEQEPEKDKRLARRMRKLTGTIAELQSRLDALTRGEEGEEATEEAASSTETVDEEADKPLARPMLRDFEDTDEKSAWDQYEEALDAYNQALTERKVAAALAKQKQALEEEHARTSAQAEWNRAAARFADYNEVVANPAVKISAAMESVMRMDPEAGTEIAYYLGQHPEESEKIARSTLATNEREWGVALARAGMLLGEIRTRIAPPAKGAAADKGAAKPGAAAPKPAPKPQPKQQPSRASRPPAHLGGRPLAPQADPMSDQDANDYAKWVKAREAQLKKR
jgi:hypothetical protein